MQSSPLERTLLRALIDIPDVAPQLIPALEADLFENPAPVALFTFIADGYQRYQTVPSFNALRIRNDADAGHTEATFKAVAGLIDEIEAMTAIDANQAPLLL